MSLKTSFFSLSVKLKFQNVAGRRGYAWNPFARKRETVLETAEETPRFVEEENYEDMIERKQKLMILRNKSRLNPEHRNILNGKKPYEEPVAKYHNTIRYMKRTLGRYGLNALDVRAGISWPTREEVKDMQEYEKIAFPLSIQERLNNIKEERKRQEELIMSRQKDIGEKMAKMGEMIAEVQSKIAAKEAAKKEQILKQQSKIQEVRRKLLAEGISNEAMIETALVDAEKAEKKKRKEAKKAKLLKRQQMWADKMLAEARLMEMGEADNKENTDNPENKDKND